MSDSSDSSGSEPEMVSEHDSDSTNDSGRARRAVVKPPIIISTGDSTESESSDEEAKRQAKRKPAPKTKRRRQSSEDDPFEQYRHLFDTRSEYDECMRRSEKEREQIIYEKMTKFEEKKTREAIEKRLAEQNERADSADSFRGREQKKKSEKRHRRVSSSNSSSSHEPSIKRRSSDSELDAEFHQPSEINKKKNQKKAMADLAAKRKDKEKKDAHKKAALSIDDVFGKEDSDDDSSSSSSSNSSNSSRSSSSSRASSTTRGSLQGDDQNAADLKPVDCKEDLMRARVSRHFIGTIVHTPFFKDAVVGSYVLLRAGVSSTSRHDFRILKITDVIDGNKIYELNDTKTNKAIKTKWGKQEKVYTLQYVSNSPWMEDYFLEWKAITNDEDNLPSMETIKKKEAEIKKYRTQNWTGEVVDYVVAQKKKFEVTHVNYALKKSELLRKKDAAQQEGNMTEVQRLLREIEEVDRRADQLDKKRSGDISAVTWINERNRTAQREKFFSGKMDKAFSATDTDDPFTRKKEKMRVVCGTRGGGGNSNDSPAPADAAKPAATTAAAPVSAKKEGEAQGTSKPAGKSSYFDLHANIDFDDIDFSSLPTAKDSRRNIPLMKNPLPPPPPQKKSRTTMSLDEYRARTANTASSSKI